MAGEADLLAQTSGGEGGGEPTLAGHVVRLRGLPFNSTAADVLAFFEGVATLGGETGVVFTCTPDGRPSGEAYVALAGAEAQGAALARHKEKIGPRYIEIFESSKGDMWQAVQQHGYFTTPGGRRRHHWHQQHGGGMAAAQGYGGDGGGGRGGQMGGVDDMTQAFAGARRRRRAGGAGLELGCCSGALPRLPPRLRRCKCARRGRAAGPTVTWADGPCSSPGAAAPHVWHSPHSATAGARPTQALGCRSATCRCRGRRAGARTAPPRTSSTSSTPACSRRA